MTVKTACNAVNLATSTYHRIRSKSKKESEPLSAARSPSPRALSDEQRQQVLLVLHEDRFIDKAPTEVYAGLLDEGRYLCSIRTMYRILSENKEVKERRDVLRHPSYTKPELLAEAPNQVWSWDITKLRGPQKWTYYYLYVIVDIYSRMVTGWMVSPRECGELAERLITEACWNHCIEAESELIIHSDRGSPMKSKVVAQMMADLGVTKSLGRPQVCNDNPYSESNFKTLKYHPTFPEQFGSLQDAKEFCASFFDWYNNDHYHSGIALMTPSTVHYGRAAECTASRQAVLSQAFQAHPERFVKGPPKALVLPAAAWINPPITAPSEQPTSF